MAGDAAKADDLLDRARAGDKQALAALFDRYRERLRHMIRLRLDRRLAGRLDPSDVLQEAFLEASKRLTPQARERELPAFLWLRLVTGQALVDLHRRHLGAMMRDAGLEVSLHRGSLPRASSLSLAELLLGRLTSRTRAAQRAELQLRLQEALNGMDPIDREVLVLRHFEELSNVEAARVLGLEPTAASNRYIRALKRLKEALAGLPGFFEA
jgi:RNA polymerase sigma-70 factor (ECF subfamily)